VVFILLCLGKTNRRIARPWLILTLQPWMESCLVRNDLTDSLGNNMSMKEGLGYDEWSTVNIQHWPSGALNR